jgi:hypothetical protein
MLYKLLRDSHFVNTTLASISTSELIEEFNRRKGTPIRDTSDLAALYAILIALTYKEPRESTPFFEEVKNSIHYEWFGELAKIYLQNRGASFTINGEIVLNNTPNPGNFTPKAGRITNNAVNPTPNNLI